MEVSKDGNIITTTHSNVVTFWDSKEYVAFFSLIEIFRRAILILVFLVFLFNLRRAYELFTKLLNVLL